MDDFFVQPNQKIKEKEVKEKEVKVKEEIKEQKKRIISNKYLPIKLSSLGKLDAPAILHVRNYDLDDALELSLAKEDTAINSTIFVLRKMIYEGFDPAYLHEEELKEILLNIYANFWGVTIKDYTYPYTKEELESKKTPKELRDKIREGYKPTIDLPISAIKTNLIKEKFKEPIKIKNENGEEVHFRLSRIKDILDAKEYTNKKYAKEEQEVSNIKTKINDKNAKVSPAQQLEFDNFTKKKLKEITRVVEAQTLLKVNSKTLNTLNERINHIPKVDIKFWKKYNTIINKYGEFGINPEVEIISPLTKEKVLRRFQFRYLDFLSALDIQDDSEYAVSFGD